MRDTSAEISEVKALQIFHLHLVELVKGLEESVLQPVLCHPLVILQHNISNVLTVSVTPWFWHGQRLLQGSPGIFLFELVLGDTLPGVEPGKIAPLLDHIMG